MFSQKTLRAHQKKKVLFPKTEIYKNIYVIKAVFVNYGSCRKFFINEQICT